MYQHARFLPVGDTALSIEIGDSISADINRQVHNLSREIGRLAVRGILDIVPTYRSVLVYYDPQLISYVELESRLRGIEGALGESEVKTSKILEIPTVYGGEYGPDLGVVAGHNGLSEAEVAKIHSSSDYLVYMMGFTPGFAYLGGMPSRIATPRLQTPRPAIPAGSVAIAEQQTGVYPIESPGGWQLIGRTPVQLFDPSREPPVLIEPGDYMRFVPVDKLKYADIQHRVQSGTYELVTHTMDQYRWERSK
jgi:KipI family sensor histidine kinase inhibitor